MFSLYKTKILKLFKDALSFLNKKFNPLYYYNIPITEEDLKIFVKINTDYYLNKWKSKISWNWAAFFFGISWLAYRKINRWFLLVFLITIIEKIIEIKFNINKNVSLIINFIIMLSLGLFGNYMYYTEARRKISYIKKHNKEEHLIKKKLKAEGGVNFMTVIKKSFMIMLWIMFLMWYLWIGMMYLFMSIVVKYFLMITKGLLYKIKLLVSNL